MPSTQSKRIVVLKSDVAATNVSELNLSMEAIFDAPASEITYEDAGDLDEEERTKYKMIFKSAAGATIGTVTLRLIGNPIPADGSGAAVSVARAGYSFVPDARETNVALLPSPAASFERVWKQNARDASRVEVVDNVAKLDVRVIAESGFSVAQTLRSAGDNELVLIYEWSGAASGVAVSGSVTLSSSAVAGAGYTLGKIRVTDNNPSGAAVRRR